MARLLVIAVTALLAATAARAETVVYVSVAAEFAARYKAAGAERAVRLIVAKGQGHNSWEGFFRCQELVDFVIARTKAGKEGKD
jgi:hypothetical protein